MENRLQTNRHEENIMAEAVRSTRDGGYCAHHDVSDIAEKTGKVKCNICGAVVKRKFTPKSEEEDAA